MSYVGWINICSNSFGIDIHGDLHLFSFFDTSHVIFLFLPLEVVEKKVSIESCLQNSTQYLGPYDVIVYVVVIDPFS